MTPTITMLHEADVSVSAAASMVAEANAIIAEIEAAQHELRTRMDAARAELAAIAEVRQERAKTVAAARVRLNTADIADSQARAYATLAKGKRVHDDAVKQVSAAKKELTAAKKHCTSTEIEDTEVEAAAQYREIEVQKQLHLLQAELETRIAEVEAIHLGRAQAHVELGIERHAALLAALQPKLQAVEELRMHLVEAESDLADCHQEALHTLVEWPVLRKEIQALLPVNDATTRMLETTMAYLEALARDAGQMRTDFQQPWPIGEYLMVPWGCFGMPGLLMDRRQRVQQVLDAYMVYAAHANE